MKFLPLIEGKLSAALLIGLVVVCVVSGCRKELPVETAPITAKVPPALVPVSGESWLGIYSSPSEIGGFSGTVLAIGEGSILAKRLTARMIFYSDDKSMDVPTSRSGNYRGVLADEGRIYLAGAVNEGETSAKDVFVHIERYTRLRIQGRIVLLRDDALQAYEKNGSLYDYGILIKVGDSMEKGKYLDEAKHESIKVLYPDPSKGWKDPFVHGPNKP